MLYEKTNYLISLSGVYEDKEIKTLTEAERSETLSTVLSNVMTKISDKIQDLDLTGIDSSRGDIKNLKDLKDLSESIEVLKKHSDRLNSNDLSKHVGELSKAVMNLNKHAKDFKDAYKNRKTLFILNYQSTVLSLVSSISYLLSVTMLAGENSSVKVKNIIPLKAVANFNRSVENGNFKKLMKDIDVVRENAIEIDLDQYILVENYDFGNMVVSGLRGFVDRYTPDLMSTLYKSAGILTFILGAREIVYSFFRSGLDLSKILDYIKRATEYLKSFFNPRLSNTIDAEFIEKEARTNLLTSEESSDLAEREVSLDNKKVAKDVKKAVQAAKVQEDPQDGLSGDFFSF